MSMEVANNILVVDDTPTNVKVLVDMLGREGYRVLVAHEGESALEQARYALPLAILLDAMMPGMNGFEVCRRLKADAATADIPVIFMTAPGELEDKVRGFDAGGVDYIGKPFQRQEVLVRVRTHVNVRRLQLQLDQANAELAAAKAFSLAGDGDATSYRLAEIERRHFVAVLKKTRGVIEGPHGAARLLDLKPSTARFRIKKLGIRREDFEAGSG